MIYMHWGSTFFDWVADIVVVIAVVVISIIIVPWSPLLILEYFGANQKGRIVYISKALVKHSIMKETR